MNLEQIVTSKSVSQQLADAGVEHKTLFYWEQCINEQLACYKVPHVTMGNNLDDDDEIMFPAYTATELFELLPSDSHLKLWRTISGGWGFGEEENDDEIIISQTLPNALGRMVLYLSKEGLLK